MLRIFVGQTIRSSVQGRTKVLNCPHKLFVKCFSEKSVSFDNNETFGKLSKESEFKSKELHLSSDKIKTSEELEDHDGETAHYEKISDTSRPYPVDFEKKIEKLLSKRRLAEALKVFDEEMVDECVKPNEETFLLVSYACSKAGYASKAYDILIRFEKNNKSKPALYGNVFHACSNAPEENKQKSLSIARSLKSRLDKKFQSPLSSTLYHTMIAAFGRCGDLATSFSIMDEMSTKGLKISEETFNHLLQACINDKDSGFRLAMSVYRRLLMKKCNPNKYTFNLMLRAARECGIGPDFVANDILLDAMTSRQVRKFKDKLLSETKLLESPKETKEEETARDESKPKVTIVEPTDLALRTPQLPNLLTKTPNMDFVTGLSFDHLQTSHGRLQIMGDINGILDVMLNEFKTELDMKTFSLLSQCVEETEESENKLIELMNTHSVTPDIDFFNQLIKKRVTRRKYDQARNVLNLINDFNLTPDIVTFGCLSMTCVNQKHVHEMLNNLKDLGIVPNLQIITPMVTVTKEPKLMTKLLKLILKHQIQVDEKLLQRIEQFYQRFNGYVIEFEKTGSEKWPGFDRKLKDWAMFCEFYEKWQKEVKVQLHQNPWKQYKTRRDRK